MARLMRFVPVIVTVVTLLVSCTWTPFGVTNLAVKGRIDLSASVPPEAYTPLSGVWEFHPATFLTRGDESGRAAPLLLPTPGTPMPLEWGTYRLRVTLPERWVGQVLGVYLPSVNTSARCYVNGTLVGQIGSPGATAASSQPGEYHGLWYFVPPTSEMVLCVQVANWEISTGGLIEPPLVGEWRPLRWMVGLDVITVAALAGAFFMIMLYELTLTFVLRKTRQRWALYFGLLLALVIARLLLAPTLLYGYFQAFHVLVHIEYFTFWFLPPVIIRFLALRLPEDFRPDLDWILFAAAGLLTVLSLVLPLTLVSSVLVRLWQAVSLLLVVYALWRFSLALRRRRPGILPLTVALTFLVAGGVLEILRAAQLVGSAIPGRISLTLFVFIQAGSMAYDYFKTHRKTIELAEGLERLVEERTEQLRVTVRSLEAASFLDSLTGLHNRRYVYSTVFPRIQGYLKSLTRQNQAGETRRAGGRSSRGVGVLVLDLDYFKSVNDTYGHDSGDVVLQQLAKVLQTSVRQEDTVARWGGEEFVVFLEDIGPEDTLRVAEKLRTAVAASPFAVQGGQTTLSKTVSTGGCHLPFFPAEAERIDVEAAMKIADLALYEAKQTGRNRSLLLVPGPEAHRYDGVKSLALPLADLVEAGIFVRLLGAFR